MAVYVHTFIQRFMKAHNRPADFVSSCTAQRRDILGERINLSYFLAASGQKSSTWEGLP